MIWQHDYYNSVDLHPYPMITVDGLDDNFLGTFFLKSHYHFGSVTGILILSLQGRCPSDLDNNCFQQNLLKLFGLDDD